MTTENKIVAIYALGVFYSIVEEIKKAKEFPNPFDFTLSFTSATEYSISINGNKTTGGDYELNTWKTVPILSSTVQYYSPDHPTKSNQSWLWLRLSYSPSWGSDYGQMEYVNNGFIEKRIGEAIRTAIKDFTNQ